MGLPVVYSWMTRPDEDVFDFFLDYKKLLNSYCVQDRFHLSGLAYHKDKISVERQQIINGWIRSVGGIIVVLYASDYDWYRDRLEEDKRGNLLSIDKLCEANKFYTRYVDDSTAKRNNFDYSFNILPCGFYKMNSNINFVSDYDVTELTTDWLDRRHSLGL